MDKTDTEVTVPKIEVLSDTELEISKKATRILWDSEKTYKLINTLKTDCTELWDTSNPHIKNRLSRQVRLEHLAVMFGTTPEEINRKLHNLRTQFNKELRKIKRWQNTYGKAIDGYVGSGWEYFDALSFLIPPRSDNDDPADENGDDANLSEDTTMDKKKKLLKRLAEKRRYERIKSDPNLRELQRIKERMKYFQKKKNQLSMTREQKMEQRKKWREKTRAYRRKQMQQKLAETNSEEEIPSEEEIEITLEDNKSEDVLNDTALLQESGNRNNEEAKELNDIDRSSMQVKRKTLRWKPKVAATFTWPDECSATRTSNTAHTDECQIFGDFVASELRSLRTKESQRKLKRLIQKAILQVEEEEDENMS